ncbi:MAG: DUF1963 domain-containing protein [Pseudoclavibacter sp.]|nr:DUF1963 domain-containing protein [Pseudoclavibacter sp.]
MTFGRRRRPGPEPEPGPEFLALLERLAEQTLAPSIEIAARRTARLPMTASRFGGLPYLPRGGTAPRNPLGRTMAFLAQIRLEELPALDPLPARGLLQFWIGPDECHGLSEGLANEHLVLFDPEPDGTVAEEDVRSAYRPEEERIRSPIEPGAMFALEFTLVRQSMTPMDHRFDACFLAAWREAFPERPLDDWYRLGPRHTQCVLDRLSALGHRIGGSAGFIQDDPRAFGDRDLDFLLLQVDSGDGISWGDAGIGNFFIAAEALRRGDVRRTGYGWDCF